MEVRAFGAVRQAPPPSTPQSDAPFPWIVEGLWAAARQSMRF